MGTILILLLVVFGIYWGFSTIGKSSKDAETVKQGTRKTYVELEDELIEEYYAQTKNLDTAYQKMCWEIRKRGYEIASLRTDFDISWYTTNGVRRISSYYHGRDSSIVRSRKEDYRKWAGDKYTREGMEKYVYGTPMPTNKREYDNEFKHSMKLMNKLTPPKQLVVSSEYGLCQIKSVSYWEKPGHTPIYVATQLSTGKDVCFPYNQAFPAVNVTK